MQECLGRVAIDQRSKAVGIEFRSAEPFEFWQKTPDQCWPIVMSGGDVGRTQKQAVVAGQRRREGAVHGGGQVSYVEEGAVLPERRPFEVGIVAAGLFDCCVDGFRENTGRP